MLMIGELLEIDNAIDERAANDSSGGRYLRERWVGVVRRRRAQQESY